MDFNSLQAQREACDAFIRSQRGEGWRLIPTAYDDGGISGGTMERPALRRLMADIESRLVDVVVVYKVDRLTRSLSDFSKMVEVFDRLGVSFVAVTQQFNTTSSMGRLTLNVLLSFAQFEREVTGERIRDKIAASKRKGIWMGGGLPRGYRVEDRKLIVIPNDAEVVRTIFRRYLECSSLRELTLALRREGIVSRPKSGESVGTISRGALYALLRSPIYVGLIAHEGELFTGQHEAIVDRAVWDAAQEKLKAGAAYQGRARRQTENGPLIAKLFDAEHRKLTPIHGAKNGKRYRYYVSHTDDLDEDRFNQRDSTNWRLPAIEIEQRVGDIVAEMLSDPAEIARAAIEAEVPVNGVEGFLQRIPNNGLQERLALVRRVQLHQDRLVVEIVLPGPKPLLLQKTVAIVLKQRGCERRIVIEGKTDKPSRADPFAIRALRCGLRFWEQMSANEPQSAVEFAKAEELDNRYVGRALPLAFLAPDIVELIVAGRQTPDWTAEKLLRWDPLPLDWNEQRRVLRVE